MWLQTYSSRRRRIQRAVVGLIRLVGTELDDVGKTALRRPGFFGKPLLDLAQASVRGPSRGTHCLNHLGRRVVPQQVSELTQDDVLSMQRARRVLEEHVVRSRHRQPHAARADWC